MSKRRNLTSLESTILNFIQEQKNGATRAAIIKNLVSIGYDSVFMEGEVDRVITFLKGRKEITMHTKIEGKNSYAATQRPATTTIAIKGTVEPKKVIIVRKKKDGDRTFNLGLFLDTNSRFIKPSTHREYMYSNNCVITAYLSHVDMLETIYNAHKEAQPDLEFVVTDSIDRAILADEHYNSDNPRIRPFLEGYFKQFEPVEPQVVLEKIARGDFDLTVPEKQALQSLALNLVGTVS